MKRLMVVLLALSLLVMAQPFMSVAADGDAYSNAKADFYVYGNRNNEGATAYAIINYAKGADKWIITGEIVGARPDTYTLSVGTGGTCEGNFEIVNFTTDENGYATFGATIFHDVAADFPLDYNIVRIYKQGNACNTELTAPAADGSLKFRGLNRIKQATQDELW
jgi:hypothetical protein